MSDNRSYRERARLNRVRKKRENKRKRTYVLIGAVVVVVLLVILGIVLHNCNSNNSESSDKGKISEKKVEATSKPVETVEPIVTATPFAFEASADGDTEKFSKSVASKHGVVIDVENGRIVAQKGSKKMIYPASMTKVMTVLVAAEHISQEQLADKVKITLDITDYCFSHDCSAVGFAKNENVTVEDLFYGTILPSGADAGVALANYVAGSHEAFVDMMNEKATELGIGDTTHFTNCVGIYDDDHYSTAYDMAKIIKAASENELCTKVLNARTYTTSKTKKHPKGIQISNWFLRRIEDKDINGEILYAKTGFVNQSGSCAASMAKDKEGHLFICVTAGSTSSWKCIYDQVELYHTYMKKSSD